MPTGDPPEPGERGQYDRHDHSCNRALEILALNLVETRKLLHHLVSHVCGPSSDNTAILTAIAQLKETIMATAAELTADLKLVLDKQKKTIAEIQAVQTATDQLKAKIVELEALVAAGGSITQELIDTVAEVKAGADVVDDQIPDLEQPA